MRIPLDYYRILGLPIQATAEQLQQAHRDRIQQLPRRDFSEAAISARKQLIDQAYTVLSDAARRQEYDAGFLAKSYDLQEAGRAADEEDPLAVSQETIDPELGIDPYTPSIEIAETQFVGALLILLELGEYELVLRLGRPYLNEGAGGFKSGSFGDPDTVAADVVLTLALAHLELGREQWQQGQYESAAASLEQGQELLLREGLFANIRGEMQSDLFKLRPYRILELVSLPNDYEEARRQGISLLEDMLHDRGGIDGAGDDSSGLGVDDFLRFIQQLRSYLTSAEQQMLFEAEARRPSAVATYLAVYALLSRGFAQHQPALIRRAKMLLLRLGSHQDVHLEQAVCSLLLGQTEEASRALELSQEFESLSFIRDHSHGSPDLLPGLCLYSERWFQNEVFPHFRDLLKKQVSLTEYFADEEVQLYLEDLPSEAETQSPPTTPYPALRRDVDLPQESKSLGQNLGRYSSTATIDAPDYAVNSVTAASAASTGTLAAEESSSQPVSSSPKNSGRGKRQPTQEAVRQPSNGNRPPTTRRPASWSTSNLRLDRILLLAALGLLGLMLLGVLVGKLLNRPATRTEPVAAAGSIVGVEPVFSEFAKTQAGSVITSAPLTEENAPEIIRSWLSAKAAAMGEDHDIEPLENILIDPALAQQKARVEALQASDSYWQLEHSGVEVDSVETTEADPDAADSEAETDVDDTETEDTEVDAAEEADQTDAADETDAASESTAETGSDAEDGQAASIVASVTEKADLYSDGQLDAGSSYNSTVRVQYDLVRQDGQWRIRDMEVLE